MQSTTPVRTVSVFGCGYLGATHAAVLAHHGFHVIGIEPDERKVRILQSGRAPFYEPGLDRLLAEGRRSGRLLFTSDLNAAAAANVHFICVGTPQAVDGGGADLSQIWSAVANIAAVAAAGDVVVGKSTVPVGTAAEAAARLAPAGAHLLWNPEFLREGFAVADTITPDRIVVGCDAPDGADAAAIATLRAVYQHQIRDGVPLLVTNLATAELVKGAANAFLATKISFINGVAELCAASGGDVVDLATAIGLDVRIGSKFLRAGIGFGGGCLPKDIRSLAWRGTELGATGIPALLDVVDRINLDARERVIQMVHAAADGGPVCVLGLAFKPESDDVRDSPALALIHGLVRLGHRVTVSDPCAAADAAVAAGAVFERDPITAAAGTVCVVVATEWQAYRDLDPGLVGDVMTARQVVDARNCLDRDQWESYGFSFTGVGR
jgi:UDPglucose 6-dehydrogenase